MKLEHTIAGELSVTVWNERGRVEIRRVFFGGEPIGEVIERLRRAVDAPFPRYLRAGAPRRDGEAS